MLVPGLWDNQRQQTYINQGTRKIIDRYQSVTDGGAWVAFGWQPSTTELVPVIKARTPRIDRETGKQIKYETPKGSAAVPYFAMVPYAYGLSIARKLGLKELQAYKDRIGVVDIDLIDHNFWPWVIDRSWPITITEGVKKALALVAQGITAIGLRVG